MRGSEHSTGPTSALGLTCWASQLRLCGVNDSQCVLGQALEGPKSAGSPQQRVSCEARTCRMEADGCLGPATRGNSAPGDWKPSTDIAARTSPGAVRLEPAVLNDHWEKRRTPVLRWKPVHGPYPPSPGPRSPRACGPGLAAGVMLNCYGGFSVSVSVLNSLDRGPSVNHTQPCCD